MRPFGKVPLVGIFIIGTAAMILIGIVAVAALSFGISWLAHPGGPLSGLSATLDFPAVGAELPDYGEAAWDVPLVGPGGETLTLGEFRGRPILLNVWATWCPPCRSEMSSLARLAASLDDESIVVVAVSEESAGTVADYASRQGLGMPLYSTPALLPAVFASDAIPATFIIDPEGHVVFQHVGAADWDDDACRAFLRSLAPGPGGSGPVARAAEVNP